MLVNYHSPTPHARTHVSRITYWLLFRSLIYLVAEATTVVVVVAVVVDKETAVVAVVVPAEAAARPQR